MRRTTIVAGAAAAGVGLLGMIWFGLYLAQSMLGFADTDDPALRAGSAAAIGEDERGRLVRRIWRLIG